MVICITLVVGILSDATCNNNISEFLPIAARLINTLCNILLIIERECFNFIGRSVLGNSTQQ